MCQGFSHFSGFLHHFVLAKLANSSISVNSYMFDQHLRYFYIILIIDNRHEINKWKARQVCLIRL